MTKHTAMIQWVDFNEERCMLGKVTFFIGMFYQNHSSKAMVATVEISKEDMYELKVSDMKIPIPVSDFKKLVWLKESDKPSFSLEDMKRAFIAGDKWGFCEGADIQKATNHLSMNDWFKEKYGIDI